MKTKQKSPSNTQEPATPSAEQVDSPPEKTPAPPVEPPVRGEDGDLSAHAPHWKIYGYFDKIPPYLLPSDLDVPKIDYIFPPPTPVELLAFATAIHGSGPLPRNRKALEKLFSQAFVSGGNLSIKLRHTPGTSFLTRKQCRAPMIWSRRTLKASKISSDMSQD